VERLLEAGDAEAALALLDPKACEDPFLENARGVCLMRLGRSTAAVDLYRTLLVEGDTVSLKPDLPAAFLINYATALLLEQNVAGCLGTLAELMRDEDPMVQALRAAVQRWRRELGWWGRMLLSITGVVRKPLSLDFPPGKVVRPGSDVPTQAA